MGLLDFFSRKNAQDNDSVKQDITEMKASIANLSEKVRVGDKNIETIYDAMGEILRDVEINSRNITTISKSAASNTDQGLNQDILLLKSQLSTIGAEILETNKKMKEIMRISRLAIQNHDAINEIKRQMFSIEKEDPKKELINSEIRKNTELSSKESLVLNALLNSEIPLTYEEIATQVNISPITVKGYINSIKKANSAIILENIKGRGRKAYSIKSEYRIKVLSGK
ncbi:MAG: hypothetical protein ABIF85_02525 [Nanoarchaeota archaeon]|nr:hypothetical protein [Nanoarchaeota archaeon]MBU4451520.1 hypothetical protein [Nanoarchaeota archaeon]MCG2723970.1 hypothetical protein [archaeon]